MKTNLYFFCLLAGLLFSCKSERTAPITSVSQLEARLLELYSQSALPGFSVAIVNPNGLIYQKGFGYANLEMKTPYTPETIQPIGSVSKTFIALALQKAIEQGYFALDTPINELLPFQVSNPHFPGKQITLRHLVTHTSGILDQEAAYEQTYQFVKTPTITLKDYLSDYLLPNGKLYKTENFAPQEPGITYHYSNIGSALAAYLIEVATHTPYSDYVRKNILDPLQMTDSHWFYEADKSDQYASLYDANKKPYDFYTLVTYPDGGLRTSCRDLSTYLIEMIKGYQRQGSLLNTSSYEALFKPQFTEANKPQQMPEKYPNSAIFWAINRSGRLTHTGGDPGLAAFISFDPVTQIGRILLINTEIDESEVLTQQVAQLVEALQNFESHQK